MGQVIALKMDDAALVASIKKSVAQGDASTSTAEKFYRKAGLDLIELKARTLGHFKATVVADVGISYSRAKELMRIAEGKVTLKELREGKRQSAAKVRKKKQKKGPLRSGPVQAPDSSATVIEQVNALTMQLSAFTHEYELQFRRWMATKPPLSRETIGALFRMLSICAEQINDLAHEVENLP